MTTSAQAYAKINVVLGVGAARPDGYHELESVFQSVNLHDTVTVTSTGATTIDPEETVAGLTISGPEAKTVPTDQSNLAWKAIITVAKALTHADHDRELPVVEIHIDKVIPTAGGMAGGSSDGAAALVAYVKEAGAEGFLGKQKLLDCALDLGSDVPFTLLGGTMVGTGRGEVLTPIRCAEKTCYHWVIATQDRGLATPAVFAEFDRLVASGATTTQSPASTAAAVRALERGAEAEKLAEVLANDLEQPAMVLFPALKELKDFGLAHSALAAMVSGSGPTMLFLVADENAAAGLVAALRGSTLCNKVVATTSPAPARTWKE